ncbi:hypothetical protein ACWDM8_21730 [Streptomyces rubiginosohelvolus]
MRETFTRWRRGAASGATALLMLAGAVGIAATPAAAAGVGTQPVSSYTFNSAPGDYIGQGGTGSYKAPRANVVAENPAAFDPGLIRVWVSDEDVTWTIEFAGARGELLKPGVYRNAERTAFRTGRSPGLSVGGDGRGCNEVHGQFTVNQVAHDAEGTVTLLDATFTQHCGSADAPPLKGTVKYRALPLSFAYDSDPGNWIGQGTKNTYTGSTSTFEVQGTDEDLTYEASGKRADWSVRLTPPEGEKLVTGRLYRAERFSGAGIAGLDVTAFHRGCNLSTGEFTLTRLVTDDATGEVKAFAATFTQRCDDAEGALRGTVRYFA